MPKYRNKMRLRKLLRKRMDTVDDLTRTLVLNGYSDEIVKDVTKNGIERFVANWEDSVKWIVSKCCPDEYEYDLYSRTILYSVMQHSSLEQIKPFQKRIELADAKFRKATIETDKPIDYREGVNRETHWWLYRGWLSPPKHKKG